MKNKNVKIFAVLMAAASLTTTPVLAADSNDYILLLPKTEGITYVVCKSLIFFFEFK